MAWILQNVNEVVHNLQIEVYKLEIAAGPNYDTGRLTVTKYKSSNHSCHYFVLNVQASTNDMMTEVHTTPEVTTHKYHEDTPNTAPLRTGTTQQK